MAALPAGFAVPGSQPGALDDDVADILNRDIPWETYLTARLITDKDLQLIRRYDKRSDELKSSLLDEGGPAYVDAFLAVLRNVTKEETVQYVLALLCQMLAVNPSRAKLFHMLSDPTHPDPYAVFLRLLQRQDWFTQEKACKLLTQVLQCRPVRAAPFANGVVSNGEASTSHAPSSPPDAAEQATSAFIDWLCTQLRRPANPTRSVPTAAAALAQLLREKGARALFSRAGGVQLLAPLLRSCNSPTNSQLLYEITMCLWQLSFHKPAAEAMASSGVVKGLTEVVRYAQKEKVVRVGLMALANLLQHAELQLGGDAVEAGLPKVVATRALQSWGDEDVAGVLEALGEALRAEVSSLSSWDLYRKEVLSGSLDWGPMHTADAFWRQNVERFEDKDFQVLRVLLKLLEASRETRTLAVGCNDLGRFIEFHPHGRFIVTDLRGKELAMRLMSHPDPEVAKRALLCVQKIMLPRDKLDWLQAAAPSG